MSYNLAAADGPIEPIIAKKTQMKILERRDSGVTGLKTGGGGQNNVFTKFKTSRELIHFSSMSSFFYYVFKLTLY